MLLPRPRLTSPRRESGADRRLSHLTNFAARLDGLAPHLADAAPWHPWEGTSRHGPAKTLRLGRTVSAAP
ncbi:hypothetical protein GCM10010347_43380 [Streptomyces cirratus]|uniref:Uncharacterized protein n=1 Tax=Streptomyces cirratus TaxID=68187 RepID=A0ABQ3EWD2_9ACTN|nr:hypothetical protein GCM10010347_43380 [Streptomyces cirratus]